MAENTTKIKTLISYQTEIEKQEIELTVLTDISLIPQIYSIFTHLLSGNNQYKERSVLFRKLFIFVVLMLYSPGSIFRGKRTFRGLRHQIAQVLNVTNEQHISDYSGHVRFLYSTYADFRDQADYLYSEILFRIELNNQSVDGRE